MARFKTNMAGKPREPKPVANRPRQAQPTRRTSRSRLGSEGTSPFGRLMEGRMGNQINVGISDLAVQQGTGLLVTHALGSCVGVVAVDRENQIAGLLHLLLPCSHGDRAKARLKPGMFADTGFAALMHALQRLGAEKTNLRFLIAGGASMIRASDFLNIGKKNVVAIRKALWSSGFLVENEHVGGSLSRTMSVDVAEGIVTIRSPNRPEVRL